MPKVAALNKQKEAIRKEQETMAQEIMDETVEIKEYIRENTLSEKNYEDKIDELEKKIGNLKKQLKQLLETQVTEEAPVTEEAQVTVEAPVTEVAPPEPVEASPEAPEAPPEAVEGTGQQETPVTEEAPVTVGDK